MALRLDRAALARYVATGLIDMIERPPQKFHARPTIVDGIRFDSTKEARRYSELKMMAAAGLIADLELQPQYPIDIVTAGPGDSRVVRRCGVYTADFRYRDRQAGGEIVIEDTKSGPTKTTAYRLRKRLVEAIHGITIREV